MSGTGIVLSPNLVGIPLHHLEFGVQVIWRVWLCGQKRYVNKTYPRMTLSDHSQLDLICEYGDIRQATNVDWRTDYIIKGGYTTEPDSPWGIEGLGLWAGDNE